jgi:hypothetical protein
MQQWKFYVHPLMSRQKEQLTKSVAQEPEGSPSHSQQPATGTCPELVESNSHPHKPISPRSILIPSSHLRLGLPSGLFPLGFPTKTLYTFLSSPMHATCPAHLIRLHLICLKDIWGWVQITKFLTVQLPPFHVSETLY